MNSASIREDETSVLANRWRSSLRPIVNKMHVYVLRFHSEEPAGVYERARLVTGDALICACEDRKKCFHLPVQFIVCVVCFFLRALCVHTSS